VKTIEERFWEKVDKTETCWNWTAGQQKGYGAFSIARRPTGAHRYSYAAVHGPIPDGLEIDHICHNRLCVNPQHLRAVTSKQNGENLRGAYSNSRSGVRGVSWFKRDSKWRAEVGHNGGRVWLGYFDSLQDAESAVIAKRNELFTHNDLDKAA